MRRLLLIVLLFAPATSHAAEIYRWVDENGVPNFSQNAPPAGTEGVTRVELDNAAPAGYDPDEDIYQVEAQAERMAALREEMAERREARLERAQNAARQQPVQYHQPYPYARPAWWHPPLYPKPPVEPPPPVPEPYETRILIPPGSRPD